jgi:chemotaxis protein methyltransferase CheR
VIAHAASEAPRFRTWIAHRFGLHFDEAKLESLSAILDWRAEKRGLAPDAYLDRLEVADIDGELQSLVQELTVPETYFFRHIDQFRAFADVALPQAQSARASARNLRLLSAGCASGEEPYSLAMTVRERGADQGWNVAIQAFDVNPAMLLKARAGSYSAWALRETPPESQRRWFRGSDKSFELDRSIRAAVSFREVNLAQENTDLWAPHTYDVIFCRNVLMYFTPECAHALVARMTRSLAPGGHLFLGHAETLRGLSSDYHLCHTHGTFYYQRRDPLSGATAAWQESPQGAVPEPKIPIAESSEAKNWVQAIQLASDRIQLLTERPTAALALRAGGGPRPANQAATQLQLALELLKQERFSDALELMGRLPMESDKDPDVLLLRAALLTHSGRLADAEHASSLLLTRDELNTGAHYLLALCRESAGDTQGALDHDQAAIYLDPEFAMPHLHLGLMARRASDWESARRELAQALLLLQREEVSRLLLFGGGFGREALIALCRAELQTAGGAP